MVDQQLITTANNLDGYKITKHLGLVRGITVRSRSLLGNIAGGFQSLVWRTDFHLCRALRKNKGRSFSTHDTTRK